MTYCIHLLIHSNSNKTVKGRQSETGNGREVIILLWPYLLLTPTTQDREQLDGWHNSALLTSQRTLRFIHQQSDSLVSHCGPVDEMRTGTVQRIMANQPAIIATPPMGATLRRPGSPVRAWWYREPQNIPIPAIRRVPACREGRQRRHTRNIFKSVYLITKVTAATNCRCKAVIFKTKSSLVCSQTKLSAQQAEGSTLFAIPCVFTGWHPHCTEMVQGYSGGTRKLQLPQNKAQTYLYGCKLKKYSLQPVT